MTNPNVSITFDMNWKALFLILKPSAMLKKLHINMVKTNLRAGKLMEKRVREKIRTDKFDDNARLTIVLKNLKNEPLKGGTGQLYQSVTSKMSDTSHYSVFVGVLRKDERYNVARVVHEGKSIPVSDKMRNMFKLLYRASLGYTGQKKMLRGRALQLYNMNKLNEWYPLNPSTNFIVIPERPFIRRAFTDRRNIQDVVEMWNTTFEGIWEK